MARPGQGFDGPNTLSIMFEFHLYQLTALVFGAVLWVVGLTVLYWVIRLAVRHAIADAVKRRATLTPSRLTPRLRGALI